MFWKSAGKETKLTREVACAGCASKLSPVLLRQAVASLAQKTDPNLLVGFDKADDAGVYKVSNELALVQTVDFFTPIVDDPLWYGRIAAANALSDIYAMGGVPLTALNILCFPEKLGPGVASQILRGGLEKLDEARCTLVGGHSVSDKELKFGMAITGTINPGRIFSNDKAVPGQVLIFTKRLGTGIITTAAKMNKCPRELLDRAMNQMATLNDRAASAMIQTHATSCTDVTGFSFLGHLAEMTRASGVKARIEFSGIPLFEDLEGLIRKGCLTRGDKTNRLYAPDVEFAGIQDWAKSVLYDPQTSGGLLISLPREDVEKFKAVCEAWVVGEMVSKDAEGSIEVVP